MWRWILRRAFRHAACSNCQKETSDIHGEHVWNSRWCHVARPAEALSAVGATLPHHHPRSRLKIPKNLGAGPVVIGPPGLVVPPWLVGLPQPTMNHQVTIPSSWFKRRPQNSSHDCPVTAPTFLTYMSESWPIFDILLQVIEYLIIHDLMVIIIPVNQIDDHVWYWCLIAMTFTSLYPYQQVLYRYCCNYWSLFSIINPIIQHH